MATSSIFHSFVLDGKNAEKFISILDTFDEEQTNNNLPKVKSKIISAPDEIRALIEKRFSGNF